MSRLLPEFQERSARLSQALLRAGGEGWERFAFDTLAFVGEHMHAARAYVFEFRGELASNTHEWCRPGVTPQMEHLQGLPIAAFESFMVPLRAGAPLYIPSVAALPAVDATREALLAQGIERLVAVPLVGPGGLAGFLGIDDPEVEDAAALVPPLQLMGDLLSAALARRESTRELEEKRALLEGVLRTTSAIVYSFSPADPQRGYVSDSLRNVLGHPPDAAAAPGFWEQHVHPEDRGRYLLTLEQLAGSGRLVHEYRFRHAEGGYRWLRDELRLVQEAGGSRVVGAAFDVTERVDAERRLLDQAALSGLVATASRTLLDAPSADMPGALREALAEIGEGVGARRVWLVPDLDAGAGYVWPGSTPPSVSVQALRAAMDAELAMLADEPSPGGERVRGLLGVESAWLARLAGRTGLFVVEAPAAYAVGRIDVARTARLLADVLAAGLRRHEDHLAIHRLSEAAEARVRERQSLLDLIARLEGAGSVEAMWTSFVEGLPGLVACDACAAVVPSGAEAPPRVFRSTAPASEADPEIFGPGSAHARARASMQVLVSTAPGEPAHPDWRAMTGCRSFITSPSFQHGAETLTLTLASRQEGWSGSVARTLVVELTSLLALHFEAWSAREALGRINAELEQRVLERTRALRESEERFQRFFEEAPQAMLVVELSSGLVTQSNARASTLFGHSAEELQRLPIDELVPEELRAAHGVHRAHFSSGPATARAMSNRTFAARRRDGRSFDVEIGLVKVADQAIVGLTDVSERVAAMEALRRSIAEKETLLREVHHRVKNNLQIVTSLLEMQQSATDDAKALGVIREAAGRVRAMALVHQSLYQSESLDRVELDAYLRRIVTGLQSSIGSSARLEVVVAPVQVAIEVAVPLGLLVNELLTNAFKYGARPGADGAEVRLTLEGQGPHFALVVHDAGPGLPAGADSDRPKTLGLKLARALARQIGARLTYTYDEGSRFLVEAETSVPADRGKAR